MTAGGIAAGVRAVARLAVQQHLLWPVRLRRYNRRSAPFLYRSPYGPRFRLEPNETVDRHIAVEGIYEGRFLEFIRTVLPRGAVVLDVGANIGNHALFLRRICSEVHCFEPNPRAWRRLEENIALNHAGNIAVHRCGLGERDRSESFLDNVTGNLGGSRFVAQSETAEGGALIELPIRRGDDVVAELNLPRLDYIKVDVEGFEREVFAGLRNTLAKYRPIVSFEHHGEWLGTDVFDSILSDLPGYRAFELTYAPVGSSLRKRVAWHFAHGGRPELTEVRHPEERPYDLIAIPEERCEAVKQSLR